MAAPREPVGEAAFARRIDPEREPGLSPEQRQLRSRNVLLALGIGVVTAGICILQAGGRAVWAAGRRCVP